LIPVQLRIDTGSSKPIGGRICSANSAGTGSSTQLWLFVLFLVYTTASELNALFGHGEPLKILFSRRPSQLKAMRERASQR
jgi:hypothetical protein